MAMTEKKTWKEFRDAGMLWWANSLLHMMGWAIAIDIDDKGEMIGAVPMRVKYRGFNPESNDAGYQKVSQYMADNAEQLRKEAFEEDGE